MSSNFPLRLPASLEGAAERLAQEEGFSLNQLIAMAVAQKVSVLDTARYLQQRAARADRRAFDAVLDRTGRGNPPDPDDEFLPDAVGAERARST